jgi:hypothetical protein
MNGKGIFLFRNRESLEGEFNDGKVKGNGKYYFKNGGVFVGNFGSEKNHDVNIYYNEKSYEIIKDIILSNNHILLDLNVGKFLEKEEEEFNLGQVSLKKEEQIGVKLLHHLIFFLATKFSDDIRILNSEVDNSNFKKIEKEYPLFSSYYYKIYSIIFKLKKVLLSVSQIVHVVYFIFFLFISFFFLIKIYKGIVFNKLFQICLEELKEKDLEVLVVVVFIIAYKYLGFIFFLFVSFMLLIIFN